MGRYASDIKQLLSMFSDATANMNATARWRFRVALRDRLIPHFGVQDAQKVAGLMKVELPADMGDDDVETLVNFFALTLIKARDLYAQDFAAVSLMDIVPEINIKIS